MVLEELAELPRLEVGLRAGRAEPGVPVLRPGVLGEPGVQAPRLEEREERRAGPAPREPQVRVPRAQQLLEQARGVRPQQQGPLPVFR